MNNLALCLFSVIIIGPGATLTTDLWTLFLKHVFNVTPSNICLVGRWLRYMPERIFKHSNIASAPQKSAESTVGWIAHDIFGITFAIAFVALAGSNWLQHPTLIPAIIFGVVTVLMPFFIYATFIYYVVHPMILLFFPAYTVVQNAKSLKTEVTRGDAL